MGAGQRNGPSGQRWIDGSAVLPAAAIAAGATSEITSAVAGAVLQDLAIACPRAALDAGLLVAWVRVSAADTVGIGVMNPTAAPITPAAAITFDVRVIPQ